MALACLAALAKLADLPTFLTSISTWRLIPPWTRIPLAVGVPIFELGAGTLWFLGLYRRGVLVVLWVGLFFVTVVYALHVALVGPPDCNCFGVLLRYERWVHQAWLVIGRNTLLLIAIAVAGALWWPRRAEKAASPA